MTAASATDPAGTVGVSAAEFLVAKIQDVRSMISGLSLSKTIPVGNGDAGAYTNVQLLSAVDYFMSNIHPWCVGRMEGNIVGWWLTFPWRIGSVALLLIKPLAGVSRRHEVGCHQWLCANLNFTPAAWQFFQDNNVAMAAQTTNKPELIIAEIGWPSVRVVARVTEVDQADSNTLSSRMCRNRPTLPTQLMDHQPPTFQHSRLSWTAGSAQPTLTKRSTCKFMDSVLYTRAPGLTLWALLFFSWFENMDQPWKDALYGGVEGWWGLFSST